MVIDWKVSLSVHLKKHLPHKLGAEALKTLYNNLVRHGKAVAQGCGVICVPNKTYFDETLICLMRIRDKRPEHIEFNMVDLTDIRMGSSRYEEYPTLNSLDHSLIIVYSTMEFVRNKQHGSVFNELLDMQLNEGRQAWIFFKGTAQQFKGYHSETADKLISDGVAFIEVNNENRVVVIDAEKLPTLTAGEYIQVKTEEGAESPKIVTVQKHVNCADTVISTTEEVTVDRGREYARNESSIGGGGAIKKKGVRKPRED